MDRKIHLIGSDEYAIVDDFNYSWLIQMPWKIRYDKGKKYAVFGKRINGKFKRIWMHRVIMDVDDINLEVNHENSNSLDNRVENLKIKSHHEVIMGASPKKNGQSKYKGVCLYKPRNKYRARIKINGVTKYLGYFENEKDAAIAYNKAALENYGEHAYLNNID